MAGWAALAPLKARVGHKLLVEALRAWVEARRGMADVADEAAMAAFEENLKDLSRVGGN